jgi:hypothetical protein
VLGVEKKRQWDGFIKKNYHFSLSKFIILHSFIFCTDTLIT